MSDSFIFKTDRPWPNARLKTGIIIGHTTATTSRIWIRTAKPGDFILLVYPETIDPNSDIFHAFKSVPYPALYTLPPEVIQHSIKIENYNNDTTAIVDLSDLQPLTVYRYALYGDNEKRIMLGQDSVYRFRTHPDQSTPFSFGFYSCHMPYKKSLFGKTNVLNMEMWDCFSDALERHYDVDLRFVIAGGDQAYVDGVKTLSIWEYLNKMMRKENGKLLPTQDSMVSWYRDIYRGYWGFNSVKKIYSRYPMYMIWDDHEIGDGWGSYYFKKNKKKNDLRKVLHALDNEEKDLTTEDGHELIKRMGAAAKQVYTEYQHSHNPDTAPNQYDYSFNNKHTAVYVLDGRGYRDVNRDGNRILGKEQLDRFETWLDHLDPSQIKYLFVVSAVPVLHLSAVLVNKDMNFLIKKLGLSDDLRDSWEHKIHDKERKSLMQALFKTADKGIKVSILSGDVHTSAVFRMQDKSTNSIIYQLTSSAITYNVSRPLGWVLAAGVPDDGETKEGYHFERVALYTDSNFSIIKVDPIRDRVVFQLYGQQTISAPEGIDMDEIDQDEKPITHSIAKITLDFTNK